MLRVVRFLSRSSTEAKFHSDPGSMALCAGRFDISTKRHRREACACQNDERRDDEHGDKGGVQRNLQYRPCRGTRDLRDVDAVQKCLDLVGINRSGL